MSIKRVEWYKKSIKIKKKKINKTKMNKFFRKKHKDNLGGLEL